MKPDDESRMERMRRIGSASWFGLARGKINGGLPIMNWSGARLGRISRALD